MTMVNCFFQLRRQVLNFCCGDGVQGRGGLIHQENLRLHRQRPGDAQTLLLAAGQTQGAFS